MHTNPVRQWLREIAADVPDADAAITFLREQGYRVMAGHIDKSGRSYALIDNSCNLDLEQYGPSATRWEYGEFILVESADVTQLVRHIKLEEKKREYQYGLTNQYQEKRRRGATVKQTNDLESTENNLVLIESLGVALDAASIAIDGLIRHLGQIATEAEVAIAKFDVGEPDYAALEHIAQIARAACYTYHFRRGVGGAQGHDGEA